MITPIKFLSWVLGVVFTLGIADSFAHLTYKIGQAAIHAHMHDQISYANYTRMLWKETDHTKKRMPISENGN